jgi:hypothetical protein
MRLMSDPIGPAASHRLRHAMRVRSVGSGAELARLTGQNDVTVRSHVNGTRDSSRRKAVNPLRSPAVPRRRGHARSIN